MGVTLWVFYINKAFWFGSTQVIAGKMTGGEVLNVFFAIIIGAFSVGNAGPGITSIMTARGAAKKILDTINRQSIIDPSSTLGIFPDYMIGNIQFNNVKFHYPTREDVPILKDFTLEIKNGQQIALVGSSGSGKSTIVN